MSRRQTPLTAICAALASWALGLFVLSLLGLGAGFGPHPANPALAPPLPEVAIVQGGSRLGPLTDYLEVGQRPLMTPDRRPGMRMAGGEGAGDSPLDADLTSVLIAGSLRLAILQPRDSGRSLRVREGELLEGTGWRLQALQPRRAVFVGPGGEKVLELRVFDGKGGAAPTPAAGANAPPPPAAAPVATTDDKSEAAGGKPLEPDQQAQVEEIRRRIEARRAQLKAERARDSAKQDN